jgi:dihydroneopterin aldolase/2-amino-4-hydroxy-6-hydroxymethyldihydropteridine diphosphokinase
MGAATVTADRIELRGIRVSGTHGVLPEEQVRAQPFEVDLDIEADLAAAAASDQLADTVDYGAVVAAVASVVAGDHADLLEHLAQRIVDSVFEVAGPKAGRVLVTVRKLRPPVPYDLAWSGVSIARSRPSGHAPEAPRRRRAFVALGSNLGDRWGNLRRAREAIPDVVAASRVYETEPVGGPAGQGAFLNCVLELSTDLDPRRLLQAAQVAESAAGRVRAEHWGPRTLDVDVLMVGDLVVDDPDLVVPHPLMWERAFVLVPLADLAPELVGDRLESGLASGVRLVGTL